MMQIIAIPSVQKIVETLRTMPGVDQQRPVKGCLVHIGKGEYSAALYTAKPFEGQRRVYEDTRLYVCSVTLPPSYQRNHKTLYVCEGVHWYIMCYCDYKTAADPTYKPYHPLGPWFGMGQHAPPDMRNQPTMAMTIEELETF